MIGIERVGVYIPRGRVSHTEISAFWGGRVRPNERAVANWDEDSLTMAVAACERCLAGTLRSSVDAVILASTTLPYAEKQSAALLAEALDLSTGAETVDVGSSLRAGTQALRFGLNALAAGAKRVLVVCSDQRATEAGSRQEMEWGDGAVAFLLGPDAPVTLRLLCSEYSTAMDQWRIPGEPFGHQGDDRFTSKVLYQEGIARAIQEALRSAELTPDSVGAVAVAGQNYRAAVAAATAGGLAAKKVAGESLFSKAGHCGAATGLLALVAALETCKAGEPVLLVNYGDGTDVWLATPAATEPFGKPLSAELEGGRPVRYAQFLRFKQLLHETPLDPYTSEIALWRDAPYLARLHAPRCNRCQSIQYPPRRVCWKCKAKDDFTEVPLARTGKIYTYTVEHLFPVPESHLLTAVVDLQDGARMYTQLTDCGPDDVLIGMDVQLAFRSLHRGQGIIHYYWKAVPTRG